MFTGIIEGVGRIAALQPVGGDLRLTVAVGSLPFDAVQLGESIAVNGVCLTVIAFDASSFQADASTETLSLTTLGRLRDGALVGVFDLDSPLPGRFDEHDQCGLEAIAAAFVAALG